MTTSLARAIWVCAMLSAEGGLAAQAAPRSEPARAAENVAAVLQREAAEGVTDRLELLRPVFERLPNCQLARWQSGFVFDARGRQWRPHDEIQQAAAADERLAAYRQVRGQFPETLDGQIALARWCMKHKLEDQARAHWTKVLEFAPEHSEARSQLGFRMVQGNWIGERCIAEADARAQQAQAALGEWRTRLEKIAKGLAQRGMQQREAARQELLAINDPRAVMAIERVLCTKDVEGALLAVETLKNIRSYEAAEVLSRQAVFSPWEPVRKAAAEALKSQREYDYVPLLLGAMQSPLQSRAQVYESADGQLLYRHAFYREGKDQRELAVLDAPYRYIVPQAPRHGPPAPRSGNSEVSDAIQREIERKNFMDQARREATARAVKREAVVAQYNEAVIRLNVLLGAALAAATGETRPSSPIEWWQWWDEYNEVYVPTEKPVRTFYQSGSGAAFTSSYPLRMDCLAGKTVVWTESGPVPIEDVRVGDRVFSCDPETGCLALKPVLGKTVRPEGEQLRIQTGGDAIDSSGGHVLWVAGLGWVKARELKQGQRLHTIRGTVAIQGVARGGQQKSFNLVVADFHTFFAGKEQVLTHDNTIRRPTNRLVPGLDPKVRPAFQPD